MDHDHDDDRPPHHNAFSPLQNSRTLGRPLNTAVKCCPSMDLVALAGEHGVVVRRVLSWQRLLEIDVRCRALCWSPDGRALCVGRDDGGARSFVVEDGGGDEAAHVLAPWTATTQQKAIPPTTPDHKSTLGLPSPSPAVTRSRALRLRVSGDSHGTTGEKVRAVSVASGMLPHDDEPAIVSVAWAEFSPHPEADSDDEYLEEEAAWRLRVRYLDRATHFLPHLETNLLNKGVGVSPANSVSPANATMPTSDTTLSLLALFDANGRLRLYLHGRYFIGTVASLNYNHRSHYSSSRKSNTTTNMICSADLSSILVSHSHSRSHSNNNNNNSMTLYSIPHLTTHRHDLQQLTASYCFLTQQLDTVAKSFTQAAVDWTNALKPLDAKLVILSDLLKDYGVTDSSPKAELLGMILGSGGSSSSSSDSALLQFFSSRLNERLLIRTTSTVESHAASVEALLRHGVSAPALAIVHAADEAYGFARAAQGLNSMSSFDNDTALRLTRAATVLYLAAEESLRRLVRARHRLADYSKWLVGTVAAFRAKGTAADSYAHENARKRRPGRAVTERVAAMLGEEPEKEEGVRYGGETEALLGVSVSQCLEGEETTGADTSLPYYHESEPDSLPSIKTALHSVNTLAKSLFEQPGEYISRSIKQQEIVFVPSSNDAPSSCGLAVHQRVGLTSQHNDNDEKGGFRPRLAPEVRHHDRDEVRSRQWFVVARAAHDVVRLVLLPDRAEYYLSARLRLPERCAVSETAFYGDDGNSSLKRGGHDDQQPRKEGRQALALLVRRTLRDGAVSEELWLVEYDRLVFDLVRVEEDGRERVEIGDDRGTVADVVVERRDGSGMDDDDDGVTLVAKTRRLRLISSSSSTNKVEDINENDVVIQQRLVASGSRGIGGVVTDGTILSLFDLEEDEELDDSDEEEEDGESLDESL